MPIELIIFDCDGVLVDSEILYARVVRTSLAELGLSLEIETLCREFSGVSQSEFREKLHQRHDLILPDDFGRSHKGLLDRMFEQELSAITGMNEFLAGLDLPFCVASNSKLSRIRKSLRHSGLAAHFDERLFSAEMVDRPKPAPDLFLLAAEKMAYQPENCLVIEDSIHGVKAAKAAGMRVIGLSAGSHCYPGHQDRLLAAGAGFAVSSVAELGPHLAVGRHIS